MSFFNKNFPFFLLLNLFFLFFSFDRYKRIDSKIEIKDNVSGIFQRRQNKLERFLQVTTKNKQLTNNFFLHKIFFIKEYLKFIKEIFFFMRKFLL
jgi:hypothetical protein